MKRSIVLVLKDGTTKELVLSKATAIKAPTGRLNLDELPDGTWRLLWNEDLLKDFSQLERIDIKLED